MNLQEYHCEYCDKLLCKGTLNDSGNMVEVKCRGCHKIVLFQGPDAEILKKRAVLIKVGLIPDPERD